MNYFVVDPTGQKYGPASVDVLNDWIKEDRLAPNSLLEDAVTGQRLSASQVPGLMFPISPAPAPPAPSAPMPPSPMSPPGSPLGGPAPGQFSTPPSAMPGSPYVRPDYGVDMAAADKKVKTAWIVGSIGLLCCPIVFSVWGIVVAGQAEQVGHPNAKNAKIFCIVTLCLGIAISVTLRGSGVFR